MASLDRSLNRIPDRFPIGTKYVVEGRVQAAGQAQVFSRYLEFPDGTQIKLADAVVEPNVKGRRRKVRSTAH